MAVALHSFKVDADGEVRISHTFYASDEKTARKLLEEHAGVCPKFGPAVKSGDTIELVEEIDELPEADEESLAEFLELDSDEEDEEEEEEQG